MLQHLAGRVWMYPSDPDPGAVQGGVAVIAGDEGSTIVDAVDFADLVVLPPTRTFTSSLSVDGVEVRHVGGHHAPDSAVVAVPGSSVMLLGDCYYPPPWHLRGPEDGMDTAQLRGLEGWGSTGT